MKSISMAYLLQIYKRFISHHWIINLLALVWWQLSLGSTSAVADTLPQALLWQLYVAQQGDEIIFLPVHHFGCLCAFMWACILVRVCVCLRASVWAHSTSEQFSLTRVQHPKRSLVCCRTKAFPTILYLCLVLVHSNLLHPATCLSIWPVFPSFSYSSWVATLLLWMPIFYQLCILWPAQIPSSFLFLIIIQNIFKLCLLVHDARFCLSTLHSPFFLIFLRVLLSVLHKSFARRYDRAGPRSNRGTCGKLGKAHCGNLHGIPGICPEKIDYYPPLAQGSKRRR